MIDFNDPFYKPLWLRVLIVGSCAAWSLFEFVTGSPFWGILFGAVGTWSFYGLFITFKPRERGKPEETKD